MREYNDVIDDDVEVFYTAIKGFQLQCENSVNECRVGVIVLEFTSASQRAIRRVKGVAALRDTLVVAVILFNIVEPSRFVNHWPEFSSRKHIHCRLTGRMQSHVCIINWVIHEHLETRQSKSVALELSMLAELTQPKMLSKDFKKNFSSEC